MHKCKFELGVLQVILPLCQVGIFADWNVLSWVAQNKINCIDIREVSLCFHQPKTGLTATQAMESKSVT